MSPKRDFHLLVCGQTISSLGTWISYVGLNLYVYELFGSGKVLGSFLVARMLPALFFGPAGGALADRFHPRTVMIVTDAARALLVLGFLFSRDVSVFFALGIVLSSLDKIYMAASSALLPMIVGRSELLNANAVSRMAHSVVTIVGPALGGLLVAGASYAWVFVIDATSFVVSVASLVPIRASRGATARRRGSTTGGFAFALAFVGSHLTLAFLTAIRTVDSLGSGAYNTALPVFSRSLDAHRTGAYGWLVGAWALGALGGSWLAGRVGHRFRSDRLFAVAVVLMATGMAAMFRCRTLAWALGLGVVAGIGDGVTNVLYNTVLMRDTPEEIRGRIFGAAVALIYTAAGVGMAVSGVLIDRWPFTNVTDWASVFIVASVVVGVILTHDEVADRSADGDEASAKGERRG